MTDEQRKQTPRHRSPAYPSKGLAESIELAERIYDKERQHKAPVNAAIEDMGYSVNSSKGKRALAALLQFGLLDEEGSKEDRVIWISDLGRAIILDRREDSPARLQAIQEAALRPHIHGELWKLWGGNLPSNRTITTELELEMDFNPRATERFIRQYRNTLKFARLSGPVEQVEEDLEYAEEENNWIDAGTPTESAMQTQPQSHEEFTEITIPLIAGRMAFLRAPIPLSEREFSQLTMWISQLQSFLVEAKENYQQLGGYSDEASHEEQVGS